MRRFDSVDERMAYYRQRKDEIGNVLAETRADGLKLWGGIERVEKNLRAGTEPDEAMQQLRKVWEDAAPFLDMLDKRCKGALAYFIHEKDQMKLVIQNAKAGRDLAHGLRDFDWAEH